MCPGFGCFRLVGVEIEDASKPSKPRPGPPQGWTANGGYYGANYHAVTHPIYSYQPATEWHASPRDFAERGIYPPHPPGPYSVHKPNPAPWPLQQHLAHTPHHQTHSYDPYQPPARHSDHIRHVYPAATTPTPKETTTFRYVPAGAAPTAAAEGKNLWYGRTRQQVETDDGIVAAASGMNDHHEIAPKDPSPNQEFWCWEVESYWTRRTYDTIKEILHPGKWERHPTTGCLFFRRETH